MYSMVKELLPSDPELLFLIKALADKNPKFINWENLVDVLDTYDFNKSNAFGMIMKWQELFDTIDFNELIEDKYLYHYIQEMFGYIRESNED